MPPAAAAAAGLTKRRAAAAFSTAATPASESAATSKVKKNTKTVSESEEEEDDQGEDEDDLVDEDDSASDADDGLDATSSAPVAPVQAPRSRSSRRAREPTAAQLEAELRNSTKFVLLRSFLLVIIFLVLYTFTQWYILEPIFQPHRTASYKAQQEAELRAKIARNVCPDGQ